MGKGSCAGQQGFFLMDLMALCCILAALAAAMGMFRISAQMRQEAAMRIAAVYLADSQMSHVEELAFQGPLPEGAIPWLGMPGDLRQHGAEFQVQAIPASAGDTLQWVSVTVRWTVRGKEQSFMLERLVQPNV